MPSLVFDNKKKYRDQPENVGPSPRPGAVGTGTTLQIPNMNVTFHLNFLSSIHERSAKKPGRKWVYGWRKFFDF